MAQGRDKGTTMGSGVFVPKEGDERQRPETDPEISHPIKPCFLVDMQQRPRDDFQTDALRPAALPTASLKPGGVGGNTSSLEERLDQSSEAYLDAIYEDWNKKVDVEVETLVEGMVHLVNISSIGNKDKFRVAQETFEAQCRTESMVRAATSLLSITHSLKLLFLLSDEQQIASRRDQAADMFRQKTEHERSSAAHTLDSLLAKGGGGGGK